MATVVVCDAILKTLRNQPYPEARETLADLLAMIAYGGDSWAGDAPPLDEVRLVGRIVEQGNEDEIPPETVAERILLALRAKRRQTL